MLCGTRASLEDMVLSHLVAVDRLKNKTSLTGNVVIGPLIISSVSPLLNNSDCSIAVDSGVSIAAKSQLYKGFGWSLPDRISRIYDSTNSWKTLGFTPKWDFNRLIKEYNTEENAVNIQYGRY